MKNFSDLADIDLKINISLSISPVYENGCPGACVIVNGNKFFDGLLKEKFSMSTEIDLNSPIKIEVSMKNKIYDQFKETAIIIDSLKIDKMEIVSDYVHLANYVNERKLDIKTHYLGFNGTWALEIIEPFYQWRHRVTNQGWLLIPVRA